MGPGMSQFSWEQITLLTMFLRSLNRALPTKELWSKTPRSRADNLKLDELDVHRGAAADKSTAEEEFLHYQVSYVSRLDRCN